MKRPKYAAGAAAVVAAAMLFPPAVAQADGPVHESAPQGQEDTQLRVLDRLNELAPKWADGDDVLVTGNGDEDGFHLFVGRERDSYAFRSLATVKPFDADDRWLGQYCLTGDRKHVVVSLITSRAVNKPKYLAGGGLVYSVALADGAVKPVATGAAINSASLRCGQDGRAAVLSYSDTETTRTGVFAIDPAAAKTTRVAQLDGQFVDPVLDGDRTFLRRGNQIVRVSTAQPERAEVVHEARGGVEIAGVRGRTLEFTERAGERTVLRALDLADRKLTEQASTADPAAQLLAPAAGASRLLGTERASRTGIAAAKPKAEQYAKAAKSGPEMRVRDVSAEGKIALTDLPKAVEDKRGRREELGSGTALVWLGNGETLRTGVQLTPGTKIGTGVPEQRMTATGERSAQGNFTTPKCAVPRNQPNRQAYGPIANQTAWAVDLATLKALPGRPADYRKTGLPAYNPSSDFPVAALKPNNGRVPPVVMNGVLAQESAYKHATWRALPGSGGNPLIGDYYGAKGGLDNIDYDQADCGYGIAQVTTGMSASDTSITPNGKAKIAVDYAENITAGMQILADKWNTLQDMGIRMNNSNPELVENWYFALWAYNSGIQPSAATGNPTGCTPSPSCTDRAGNWGLGWTNNPNNDSYREGRTVFLRQSYADAARPWEWPYQERVLGWTETPIKDFKGVDAYRPALKSPGNTSSGTITYPDRKLLCTSANNCNPDTAKRCNYTEGDLAFHCWWHSPVTMQVDCSKVCAASPYAFRAGDPEPAGDNPWPPACSKGLPNNVIIVDETSSPGTNIFCNGVDWSSGGTFSLDFGKTSAGMPISEINFHQVATGMGAHTWFAGNALASEPAKRVTGTWKPNLGANGTYMVRAHIPTAGASAGSAVYKIKTANGTVSEKVINQHEHFNHWKSLGVYVLGPGSTVELSNITKTDTTADVGTVAWDALALVPVKGTYFEDKVDSVAYFDENQNLDTILPATWIAGKLESRQSIYNWAMDLTGQVVNKPVCGEVASDACVRPAVKDVFTSWRDNIVAAGTDPVNHPRGKSIPQWLGFSNHVDKRPTSAYLPDWFMNDDLAYKIRTQATASFLRGDDGRIVPGSEDVDYQHRTANTHLPPMLVPLFGALHRDYGIAPPDLQFDLVDANQHNHKTTHVNGNSTGVFNARAYRFGGAPPQLVQMPGSSGGTVDCVVAHGAGGGAIALRTALASDYLTAQVARWANQVKAARDLKNLPHGVAQTALDFQNLFFDPNPALGSPFAHASPIHHELHFASCADQSLRKVNASTPVALNSFMPDLYLYRDGQAMNLDGSARPSAEPVTRGNYGNFTALPPRQHQWGFCQRQPEGENPARADQEGNPWGMALADPADANPTSMVFCSDGTVPHHDYG
ncbi:hypothetical protein JOF53_000997 [Crossiella equi]|uniref:Golvesin/Xly CBD-like domain-containing protein n=1 Tax=Crossiella equi TaxID=130796 RepID=A0ABS5A6B0_9PSEU|nr:hypothetical protein [Crossiella equi]MBP2472125.1 hypothetical protein [Crossiella equi]